MEISPYLVFNGNCAEAFRAYERILGGELELMTHAGTPAEAHVPPEHRDRILHACLTMGDYLLMGSDSPPDHFEAAAGTHVSVAPRGVAEGKRVFEALAEGGRITMPFEETFWSPGFGMLVDRFGIPWMVNTRAAA